MDSRRKLRVRVRVSIEVLWRVRNMPPVSMECTPGERTVPEKTWPTPSRCCARNSTLCSAFIPADITDSSAERAKPYTAYTMTTTTTTTTAMTMGWVRSILVIDGGFTKEW